MLQGLELGARAMAAAGAESLFTAQAGGKAEVNFTGKLGSPLRAAELERFVQQIHQAGKLTGIITVRLLVVNA